MAGVGIDPVLRRIPESIWDEVGRGNVADGMALFSKKIIDATADATVDFKINPSFFQGEAGRRALSATFSYLKTEYPEIVRISDGKFADIGHTAEEIADEIFGNLDADGILINPYLGFDAIKPFIDWKDKLVIMCVNTSNDSAQEIQGLQLSDGQTLWRHVLDKCLDEWNYNQNIIPVLSATHQQNLDGIREIVSDTPILLAGVGSQGGDLQRSIPKALDSRGYGLLISSSRAILYPDIEGGETWQDASGRAARDLCDKIRLAKASRDPAI